MSAALRVAVIAGGRSSEHEVSLRSGAAVRGGLQEFGHDVVSVEVARDGVWRAGGAELELRAARGLLGADVAFPVMHGPYGEDGTVQGLLEALDVPYVGSGVAASALCLDKVLFKDLLAARGLPQVGYRAVRDTEWIADPQAVRARVQELGMPVFVKPARLGSSVGIAKVTEPGRLDEALRGAFDHDPLVIAEAFCAGVEVECSVLGNASPRASEPGEIRFEADFYDFDAKYRAGGMELVVPAGIPAVARERVRALAVETFERAGCRGLARVDFFVEGDHVLVNELNTMPGQTDTSVYGKLWEASGVPYPELLDRLVRLGLERHDQERAYSS